MPPITGIAHVELSVSDLERSVAWYCRLLGARDVFRGSSDDYRIDACAVYEPNSRLVLAFTRHREPLAGGFSPRRVGLDHVSFRVADRAALEEWVTWLDELGIAHSPIQDDATPVSVTFQDPDGIALELSYPGMGVSPHPHPLSRPPGEGSQPFDGGRLTSATPTCSQRSHRT